MDGCWKIARSKCIFSKAFIWVKKSQDKMLNIVQTFICFKTMFPFLDITCPDGMIFDECRSTPTDFCHGR